MDYRVVMAQEKAKARFLLGNRALLNSHLIGDLSESVACLSAVRRPCQASPPRWLVQISFTRSPPFYWVVSPFVSR
jgi:hypothetical protein